LRLGRAPSTISRELKRNGGLGSYRAHTAEQAAWDRACRPKRCKLALSRPLALKKELAGHLRRRRTIRRSRHHTQKTPDHGQITGAVSIRERPAEVEDRAVPGHWEGDLVCGRNNSQIATLVAARNVRLRNTS